MKINKMTKVTLLKGDCLEKLKELEDNSVDSVVTDPPYGLEFMGKEWDSFKTGRISKYKEGGSLDIDAIQSRKGKGGAGPSYTKRAAKRCRSCGKQEWSGSPCKCDNPDFEIDNSTQHTFQEFNEAWARECYRVLKPGGHLLAFAGSRMYHRLAVGVEDAGFEIRDQIMWIYGSGFPKSHNIALAIDKMEGATGHRGKAINIKGAGDRKDLQGKEAQNQNSEFYHKPYNEPITENAKNWNGWGTALKPAHEPIVMARKPFKGSVAENVLEWGTGGINIDGCRVGNETRTVPIHSDDVKEDNTLFGLHPTIQHERVATTEGRFPANIIFDEEAGKILDEQSGNRKGWSDQKHNSFNPYGGNSLNKSNTERDGLHKGYNDEGGASRFFYCPKASKKDRNEGLDVVEQKNNRPIGTAFTKDDNLFDQKVNNFHPTVKPTDLMAYLVRLVTPKGGVVLDPFMGSGSTGKAAAIEGMDFIGIEREDEYFQIAETRIKHITDKRKFW